MHRTTALLLWLAIWTPLAGSLYFCGLVVNAPAGLSIAISILAAAICGTWIRSLVSVDTTLTLTKRAGILLLIGIALLAIACAALSRRYGDWDAALIWNLHARHLAAGESWRSIYESGASGNAAYPLGLPSITALVWCALDTQSQTAPSILALLPTLGIPVVIFLEAARSKLWIGAVVLALFGLHRYYLALGLDQYADIQVAWLLLLAAVCIHRAHASARTGYWTAAGLLLGAMCWTKWDGVLLAACLLAPQTASLFRQPRALAVLLLGALPFLLVIILFLQTGPPPAPLLTDLAGVSARVSGGQRYRLIASAFGSEMIGRHWPLAALLLAVPLLWWKGSGRQPRRMYLSVVAAVIGYATVYLLLVSTDLDWNLRFSLPRLLLQVYPLAVFTAACAAASKDRRHTLR